MTPTPATSRPHIAVGVTGASGAIYAMRTIAALLETGCHLEIVFSDYGKRLLMDELGSDAKVDRLQDLLERKYGPAVQKGTFVVHSNKDLGATLASGSHRCSGMVIVPCSMKTLAGVALGLSRSLIERAAKAAAESYPPYNVEERAGGGLRITLAVAGFTPDTLQVTLEDRQLVVAGKRDDACLLYTSPSPRD